MELSDKNHESWPGTFMYFMIPVPVRFPAKNTVTVSVSLALKKTKVSVSVYFRFLKYENFNSSFCIIFM